MLKNLDMLIGVTVVMLLVSMTVTMLTQIAAGLVNLRGKTLKASLGNLLTQIDRRQVEPDQKAKDADQIANMVLTHPVMLESRRGFARAATVIHREELTQLLMQAAAGRDGHVSEPLRTTVNAVMAAGGVAEPGRKLDKIRLTAMAMEKNAPDMAADARINAAIIEHANLPIVGDINAWFDATIDRASSRFTALTRVWSFMIALVLVLAVQLDAFTVINHYSVDDVAREAAVSKAIDLVAAGQNDQIKDTVTKAVGSPGSLTLKDLRLDGLVKDDLIEIPDSFGMWRARWEKSGTVSHVTGMVVSIALVSLGAPFWFNVLKTLLRLRSVVAGKDDQQRQIRQSQQAAATG